MFGSLPGDDRPWDVKVDGGALRIYTSEEETSTRGALAQDSFDIAPTPGTMLLFDSAVVPHEVLETHRNRLCVVGWFGATC